MKKTSVEEFRKALPDGVMYSVIRRRTLAPDLYYWFFERENEPGTVWFFLPDADFLERAVIRFTEHGYLTIEFNDPKPPAKPSKPSKAKASGTTN